MNKTQTENEIKIFWVVFAPLFKKETVIMAREAFMCKNRRMF